MNESKTTCPTFPRIADDLISFFHENGVVVTVGPLPGIRQIFHAGETFHLEDLKAPVPEITDNLKEAYEKASEGRALWMDHPDFAERIWQEGFGEEIGYKTSMQSAFFRAKTNGTWNIHFELAKDELTSPDFLKWFKFGGFYFNLVQSFQSLELTNGILTLTDFDGRTVPMKKLFEDTALTPFEDYYWIAVNDIAVDGVKVDSIVRERNGMIFIEVRETYDEPVNFDAWIERLIHQIRKAKDHPDMFAIKRAKLLVELLKKDL